MNRLFKSGIITTIIGLVIIATSIVTWVMGKTDSTEALAISGLGMVFLRSKDSLIGVKEK